MIPSFKQLLCMIVLTTLGMTVANQCVANPLPHPEDIFPTGSIIPEDWIDFYFSSKSIFLKAEDINVTINENYASVRAIYVLKNNISNTTNLPVILPFSLRPSVIELMVNGEEWAYSWIDTDNIQVPNTYPNFTKRHSIVHVEESMQFSMIFDSFEEKEVFITYTREYHRIEMNSEDKINYRFRYIIGTARCWKYPIESAHFEFWIKNTIFDEGYITQYTQFSPQDEHTDFPPNSTQNGFVSLVVNYNNWMPEYDFLVLSWYKTKPFFSTLFGFFSSGLFIMCGLVLIGSTVFLFHYKKVFKLRRFVLPLEVVVFLLIFVLYLTSTFFSYVNPLSAFLVMIGFLFLLLFSIYFSYHLPREINYE
ncbi:MAG: hypothetical protein ACXADY_07945 [Candidatus Hodarchaeales archaeon]|jgi:hypothetical protein